MKIYFPIHLDGGNRGCEAIAKGNGRNTLTQRATNWALSQHRVGQKAKSG